MPSEIQRLHCVRRLELGRQGWKYIQIGMGMEVNLEIPENGNYLIEAEGSGNTEILTAFLLSCSNHRGKKTFTFSFIHSTFLRFQHFFNFYNVLYSKRRWKMAYAYYKTTH